MKKAPHLEFFCRLITNLVFVMFASASVAASTLLAPATNTSLPNIHMKGVRCAEVGVWSFDIVNNAFAPAHIDYFFWLEDDDADAIRGDEGQVRLGSKSRQSVNLTFTCDVPFTELRHHFQWAPSGFLAK